MNVWVAHLVKAYQMTGADLEVFPVLWHFSTEAAPQQQLWDPKKPLLRLLRRTTWCNWWGAPSNSDTTRDADIVDGNDTMTWCRRVGGVFCIARKQTARSTVMKTPYGVTDVTPDQHECDRQQGRLTNRVWTGRSEEGLKTGTTGMFMTVLDPDLEPSLKVGRTRGSEEQTIAAAA